MSPVSPRPVADVDADAGPPRPAARPVVGRSITLHAPGRLHLGFLDPAGTLGRRFGSLGLVIDGFETEIELAAAATDLLSAGPDAQDSDIGRVAAYLHALRQRSGCHQPLALHLHRSLPPHSGLGSGTQLALAVGRAFAHWHGLALGTATLAGWLGRGQRSGIGIAGFDQGGLLLDGGPGTDGSPPPLLARLRLPPAWLTVVVQDPLHRGLSGAHEKRAIAALPPLPQASAAEICHQVLMQVLPGAATADFAAFANGLNRVQQIVGAHFAPAQGGSAFTSPAVGRLLHWINQQGAAAAPLAATGQSSWGPTAFAIVPSREAAAALLAGAAAAGVIAPPLQLRTVASRNQGAVLVDRRGDGLPTDHPTEHRPEHPSEHPSEHRPDHRPERRPGR